MYWYGAGKLESDIETQLRSSENCYHIHVNRARGFAILVVVSGHILDFTVANPAAGAINFVTQLFLGNGSSIFVFISGFLYMQVCKEGQFGHFLNRKFANVLAPYMFVSMPAIVVYTLSLKSHSWLSGDFLAQSAWTTIPYFFLTGSHLGPLWFIPMIFLCYLASPALAKLTRLPKSHYIIPLLIAVPLVVPRPPSNSNPIQAFFHFVPVYVGGMLCFRYHDRLLVSWAERKKACSIVFLSLLALAVFACQYFSGASTILRAFETCAAFCVLYDYNSFRGAGWRLLEFFSATSFAVYFLHGYVLGMARCIAPSMTVELSGSSLPLVFASVLGVVTLCGLVAEVTRKTLGFRSRYLIGY